MMFEILEIIYSSKYGKILGFKGGTALYFLYGLNRFSVDLDFELIENYSNKEIKVLKHEFLSYLTSKLDNEIKIKSEGTLKHSFRFIIQYGGEKKLKLEINSKLLDNHYEIKNLLGLPINIMEIDDMVSHKLCAFFSRYKQKGSFTNRDLFDIYFLLKKGIIINEDIIKIRSKIILGKEMDVKEFFSYLIDFIKKHYKDIKKNILYGIGDLIDQDQKSFMKNEFLDRLISLLELRLM